MVKRILSILLGLVFVVVTFFLASLLVAIAIAVGLIAGAWLWWRGRRIAKGRGQVIEGEYRIIESK